MTTLQMWFGVCVFFFKEKTAYEMRISDWSSDVCSSDLCGGRRLRRSPLPAEGRLRRPRSRKQSAMAAHRAAITRRTRRSSPEGRARTNLRLVQCAEGGGDVFDHLRFGALDGEGRDPQGGEQAEPGAEEEVRSVERRVGKECVRTCRSRGSPYP